MFRISAISKVKVAGVVAAGALTLGAAGAYAAGNANNTIPVNGQTKTVTFNGLSLTALPGAPALPATFKNQGECVSWFAQHQQFALTTNGGLTTSGGNTQLAKNYHGKLMSQIGAACKTAAASATTSGSGTPPATTKKSTPETEATETETETGDQTEAETGDKAETETVDKAESSDKADKAGSHGHSDTETND